MKQRSLGSILCLIGVGLSFCLLEIFGLAGCSIQQTKATPQQVAARVKKRQIAMRKLEVSRYLADVDDSVRLVYVAISNGSAQIFSITPDGKNISQLTNTPGYKCHPQWNIAHDRIVYFHFQNEQPLDSDPATVWIMDADGSNARELVKGKKIKARIVHFSWRPDGKVVYFSEADFPTMLFGYSTETGEQVETLRLPKNSFMTTIYTISPSMKLMAGSGPSKEDHVMHTGVISRDGRQDVDMMRAFRQVPFAINAIVWSYDSVLVAYPVDKVVIVMTPFIGPNFELYPITPQDFDASLSSPTFSPMGGKLACVMEKAQEGNMGSGDQAVTTDIYVMELDGSKQTRITNVGSAFDPCW